MSKFFKISILASMLAIAIVFAFSPSPAQAAGHEFDLYVKHNINGRSLGLDKELPVDVYVNGVYTFSFNFGETFTAELPAGEYEIEVKLAGTDSSVMSLDAGYIPAGVNVAIRATLGAMKSPTLRVLVK
jgi:hypothetical protein